MVTQIALSIVTTLGILESLQVTNESGDVQLYFILRLQENDRLIQQSLSIEPLDSIDGDVKHSSWDYEKPYDW